MIELMKLITENTRKVIKESFNGINSSIKVKYPYVTFDIDSETIERNVEGFYLDMDIFDNSGNYLSIFETEAKLKAHFKRLEIMTDALYLRFNYVRSTKVPVNDERIKRRNLQFYIKVDWRTQ